METTPLTPAQKMQRRRAELNELARALGFETWIEFETKIKNAYRGSELIQIRIGKERLNAAKSDRIT